MKDNKNNQEIIKDVVLNPSILNYIDNYKNPLANFFESTQRAWYPILVDLTTTNIKNNYLSSGFTILSKDLGFESAISFDAIFENWEVSSNARMNTDWILTSLLNPKFSIL